MKYPTDKVKIGAHVYQIKYVSVPDGISVNNVAEKDSRRGVITIDSRQIDTEVKVAVWHEIFHVANGELSEEMVDWLAQTVVQVTEDNNF